MIRPADIDDHDALTRISFRSKRYWGYPEHYFKTWEKELTITPGYIKVHRVFVLEHKGDPIGYYSIVTLETDIDLSGIILPKGVWLDHMFILPEFIGKGFGRELFRHMAETCRALKIDVLNILADPNAGGFYERMGCTYVKEYPSTIENRTTPFFKWHCS